MTNSTTARKSKQISIVQEIASQNGLTLKAKPLSRPSGDEGKLRTYAYHMNFLRGNDIVHTRVIRYYQPTQLWVMTSKRRGEVVTHYSNGMSHLNNLTQELDIINKM